MHGYPEGMPPGMRLPPPPPHGLPPPHEMMYGGPPPHPPDMGVLGPPPPDMDPSCSPHGDWTRDPPPGTTDLYPRIPPDAGDTDFPYLDTSDDSGRHTGPDPSSP